MHTMPISKFKATCLRVLETIRQSGESILVTKNGAPIALVSPPNLGAKEKGFGYFKGRLEAKGDIVSSVVDEEAWEALK